MRHLSKLASISTLALALAACREPPTTSPEDAVNSPTTAPQDGQVAAATAQARTDFARVVQSYAAARADGAVRGDECERVAGEFSQVYKAHGAAMAIAQFNAGVVWEECGQADKAEAIYTGLLGAVPQFDLPYNNLGVLYWKRGQDAKALDMFKKGVEANKRQARAARNNVAGLLRDKYVGSADVGVFNEVETALQTVLALDSGNKAAYENLARIYYDRGHSKDKSYLVLANLVVSQGMRVLSGDDKKSADLYNLQGLLLLERDDQVNALKIFKEAVGVEPNHVEANLNIGFISIRFRDYATAEKAFQTALKAPAQQKNLEVWLAIGVAQRGLKKFKGAEASYNRALKLNASDPRAYYNLGVLYQDHLAVQDDVTLEGSQQLGAVARKYYLTFAEKAGKTKAYAISVLESQDRVATLEQNVEVYKETKALEEKVEKLKREQELADAAELKRLMAAEKQALADEAGAAAPAPAP